MPRTISSRRAKKKAAPATRDLFREWLASQSRAALSVRLNLSVTTIGFWKNGTHTPHPNHHQRIKDAAKADGVLLTSDDLLYLPKL